MKRKRIFTLPLRVNKNKKEKAALNLNSYRNAHFYTLSYMKKEFKKIFKREYGFFPGKPIKKCSLEYTIFFKSKRRIDLSNVASIVDKFACDCLVELGYIIDDSRDVLGLVTYRDGGVDKSNPRAELILKEL